MINTLAAKREYIGKSILPSMSFYVIIQKDGNRSGYCTFDDPTSEGGSDPVRTLVAFTNQEKAEKYIVDQLRGIGEVKVINLTTRGAGDLFRMMIKNKIYFFTFDRTPFVAIRDLGNCVFISIKLFAEVVGKYVEAVKELAMREKWLPDDSMIVDLPENVKDIVEGRNKRGS